MTDDDKTALRVTEDPTYCLLKDRVIASTGLAYYEGRDQRLAELIGERLFDLGLRDCASYLTLLKNQDADGAEWAAMIAQLTIGETYFFRDARQFEALRGVVFPEILERKQSSKQLRIWSAGCATGAEPYSLAILLGRDLMQRLRGWRVSILATDINPRFLAAAEEGRFPEWALRATPEGVKNECFSMEGQVWSIHPEYQRMISFVQMNLVGSEPQWVLHQASGFDLILCRNVMIYFAPEVNRRLVGQFHESLAEGGWFLTGAAEHGVENLDSFQRVNADGAILYRRAENVTPPQEKARVQAAQERPAPRKIEPPSVEGLRRLADRGDWMRAVSYGDSLLVRDGLNPAAYFYRALVMDQVGVPAEAEQSLRRAIYLDPNFLLAHYHLGLALSKDKKPGVAERSFKNVLKLLSGMRDDQPVAEGDGMTAGSLRWLVKMRLAEAGAA